ncbi:MAG TPA: DUF3459 domain-containing protein, partial [Acidimicrobiales bacterium]|nr:DUF3459 domain-containing protein [Acidimicrobiales bacterium]
VLEQLATEVAELAAASGRRMYLIAESDLNDPRLVTPRAAGGYGVDSQWSDDFHHALHALLTGERSGYYEDFGTAGDLCRALSGAFVYDGRYSVHRRRRHGRPVVGLPGWSFLGYLQNHDQVGNRAMGERSAALMSTGRLKVAAALVLTSPFVPMLFQGEEWAASSPFQYFTDHPDPELGRAVSEGRRREFAAFGWKPDEVPDPQDPATFDRSRLDWDELKDDPHAGVLDWHRRLIALRKSLPSLTDGRLDRVRAVHGSAGWLLVERGDVAVVVNLAPTRVEVTLGIVATEVVADSEGTAKLAGGSVRLDPDSVVVLAC